jgi:signal transduction histidine kinase/HAMP domain-containing protein
VRRGLFLKYVVLFVALVAGVLVINAALGLWFAYQENRRASIAVQHEKAEAAAQKIESFVREIERQIGWVAQPQWATLPIEQRRFDYSRLQRQVPAITEVVQLDDSGREQLKVSRITWDVVGPGTDMSKEPAFIGAKAQKVWFGPVYFRKESEPYLTIAVAHGARGGVTVAEINLKLIPFWDVVEQIKVGKDGYAFMVDREGRLIAHPDTSLVLRGTDMKHLPQVAAALAGSKAPVDAINLAGVPVLSAHATVPGLNWLVFVEVPTWQAQQPVVDYGLRALGLVVLCLLIAGLAGALLARRMVVPIRTLQAGAERIGSGEFDHRLSIKTGDELEALANQFNRAAAALEESYATLERRVEDRTRELSESLDQQTATAEVLRVISQSPTDVGPVLNAVAAAARRFCGAANVGVILRENDEVVVTAHDGALRPDVGRRWPLGRDSVMGRAIVDGRTAHVPDVMATDEYPLGRQIAHELGHRATLAAPLLRNGAAIGCILLRKPQPVAFTARQIELAETFAAQAVIAIENVRLFTELRESLEYQTAISDVLKVMSRSTFDLGPVLQTVIETAARLCRAQMGGVFQLDPDGAYRWRAGHALDPRYEEHEKATPLYPGEETLVGRVALHGATVTELDALADPRYGPKDVAEMGQVRSMLGVPMMRDGKVFGVICLARTRVEAFSEKQVEVVRVFADQAVIAIENVRLFNEIESRNKELGEALEYQTATSNVLGVISQSTFNLEPVLNTVATAASDLCHADEAAIFLLNDGVYRWAASVHINSAYVHAVRDEAFAPGNDSLIGRTALRAEVVQIVDAKSDPDYRRQDLVRLGGVRTLLGIPLLRDDAMIGVMVLTRRHVEPFSDRHIEILQVFADQAVIAIQNVRLFTEIQEKSHQLEIASQHKSQFLANMSHELRTPLNAIIGYTEMMTDGLYGDVPEKATAVLERVQANGRHLLGLINDVLDLSKIEAGQLVLAMEQYSVADMVATVLSATESLARAKKLDLRSDVAAGLPTGTGDGRRLTQVLLNLVGNAIKFTDQGSVEVRATQVDGRFELAVVDTGFGIAPGDQGKIFDEFQQVDNTSTRKKGGTGLGLSISRRIVELHGGRITVHSEVGKGSTFTVVVPVNASSIKEAAQ